MRLIRLVGLLLVATLSLTICAIVYGRQQPTPERIKHLHLADCDAPCWIGIVPGVTTFDSGLAMIAKVYNGTDGYTLEVTDLYQAGKTIRIFEKRTQNMLFKVDLFSTTQFEPLAVIDDITLSELSDLLRAGELAELIGYPIAAGLSSSNLPSVGFSSRMGVYWLSANKFRLMPDDPIHRIMLGGLLYYSWEDWHAFGACRTRFIEYFDWKQLC